MRAMAIAVLATSLLAVAPAMAKAPKVRVLVLEPDGKKFSDADRETFAGLIAAALDRRPEFEVLSSGDLARALEHQAQKQLSGCSSESCLKDVASALDAELVVFGDVNKLGKLLYTQRLPTN